MAQKVHIINSDDVVSNEPDHTDARYDRKISTLVDASKVAEWTVKEWPMLDEGDEESTNALGYPSDFFSRQRKQRQEQQQAELEAQSVKKQEIVDEPPAKEEDEQAVTAAMLDELRQAAENEGRESGYKAGHDEGYAKGREEGHDEGFKSGFDEGHAKGLEQGLNEGKEKGYSEGRTQGLKEGEDLINEQISRFRSLADALADPLREVDEEVASELVKLAGQLFAVLAGRELKSDPEFLKNTILKAVSLLPENEHAAVSISMNPDDLALCEATLGREYMQRQHWNLKADESLGSGDVIVGDGNSEIQWKMQDRVKALIEDLMDGSFQAQSNRQISDQKDLKTEENNV
ncbi:MAG TPA: hypothetical protein DCL74_01815 [Succinivibrionaceae bacterium]|nr:hypothetical protein [Succinivibrionaceae bacterium]